ncbi:L-fuculokinase [Mangrovibacter plantisponsor]|uniref:L-fuculokinase n=1 Tax=Mangrovibacter plantisponsor TaxID=451513 RepID=A0A317PVK3_9ENTR|nr:L-fuculokinase [Mangrovibacter plantisponsor]PWW06777.1 L-fuculokinase [Mangrovibacter plantisponsor]
MKQDIILVLDCGATNIRAIAVNKQGHIVGRATTENTSIPSPENPTWHLWSLDAILANFALCCQQLGTTLANCTLRAVTVTTFGVDGALVDKQGNMLYPIISWKCPRTASMVAHTDQLMPLVRRQAISGVGEFGFNTIHKLVWLKENHPEKLEQAHAWLFISSLINHRLTGKLTTDMTMAGTSQLLDIRTRTFSRDILQAIGVKENLFPPLVDAGALVGTLLPEAATQLGLPAHTPVISAGHDTQFALFGAGAAQDEPVLSSGTWEILMARTPHLDTARLTRHSGTTCESDSIPGLFNPGMQWLASGTLEWIRKLFWQADTPWSQIVDEARRIAPGCDGVQMMCDLLAGGQAGWQGVSLNTTRGHFYRAALESLSLSLKNNLQILERIGGFHTQELLMVGGGSRNTLWNQIKADTLGIPVKVLDEAETTVCGAAMFAWYGAGEFSSAGQARAQVTFHYRYFYPETPQAMASGSVASATVQ